MVSSFWFSNKIQYAFISFKCVTCPTHLIHLHLIILITDTESDSKYVIPQEVNVKQLQKITLHWGATTQPSNIAVKWNFLYLLTCSRTLTLFPVFYRIRSSLPCSQKPTISSYPQPDNPVPHLYMLSL